MQLQTLDIVDIAIHPVVCHKSDFAIAVHKFHGNSDFLNSRKLDPYKYQQRYFEPKNIQAF
jgi:hypothetical protein